MFVDVWAAMFETTTTSASRSSIVGQIKYLMLALGSVNADLDLFCLGCNVSVPAGWIKFLTIINANAKMELPGYRVSVGHVHPLRLQIQLKPIVFVQILDKFLM